MGVDFAALSHCRRDEASVVARVADAASVFVLTANAADDNASTEPAARFLLGSLHARLGGTASPRVATTAVTVQMRRSMDDFHEVVRSRASASSSTTPEGSPTLTARRVDAVPPAWCALFVDRGGLHVVGAGTRAAVVVLSGNEARMIVDADADFAASALSATACVLLLSATLTRALDATDAHRIALQHATAPVACAHALLAAAGAGTVCVVHWRAHGSAGVAETWTKTVNKEMRAAHGATAARRNLFA